MKDGNEQIIVSAQPAAAEENVGATENAISLGKFKDVDSLLKAYNSLQSEFTKRCQRIKELEGAMKVDKADETIKSAPNGIEGTAENAGENITNAQENTQTKEEVLKEYLTEILGSKQQAVVLGNVGAGIKTPTKKPTTIAQAGALAKQILNG